MRLLKQMLVDAPASISVITVEELRKKRYITLLDAVGEWEGVDIGETRDKTGQGSISMRGMGSDYTLILCVSANNCWPCLMAPATMPA